MKNNINIEGLKVGDYIEVEFNPKVFTKPWFPKKIIEQVYIDKDIIESKFIFTLTQDIFDNNKVTLSKGTVLKVGNHELYHSIKIVTGKKQLVINVSKGYEE